MEKRSAVAIEGGSVVSAPPSNKKTKSDDEITFADIPTEVLTNSILPLVGDYQYRFVGPVNHALHDAYVAAFPKKRTRSSIATQKLTLFCYHDRHRIPSLLSLYPKLARKGDLATLKYLHALDAKLTKHATESGHCNHPIHRLFAQTLQANTCAAAAGARQMDVLQWCRLKKKFYWNEITCVQAAKHGQLDVLQWCRARDCPWDAKTCEAAAKHGHYELLQWCQANGCPMDESTFEALTQKGRLDLLHWCEEVGCNRSSWTCQLAAMHGHLDIVQWCHEQGFNLKCACNLAAHSGQLEIVQFCHSKEVDWDHSTCAEAAKNGHLGVL
jgi:hypothetical protein